MARVDHYSFGRIVVDAREEQSYVILLPHRAISHWWREFEQVLGMRPPRVRAVRK
jgi:hypothetical protein